MNKKNIFSADRLFASTDSLEINNLSFKIEDGVFSVIYSEYADIVNAVILGDILATRGTIIFSGTNIATHSRYERRIEPIIMGQGGNTAKLLKKELSIAVTQSNYYEQQQKAKNAEIIRLKAKQKASKNDDTIRTQLKKAKLDLTSMQLKQKRRKTELEVSIKATQGLINSLMRDNLTEDSLTYIDKLSAKLFSLKFELSRFTHTRLPDVEINSRVKQVIKQLNLPDELPSNSIETALALAYAKAPMLMLYTDKVTPDIAKAFRDFMAKTDVTIVATAEEDAGADCDRCIKISPDIFTNKQ